MTTTPLRALTSMQDVVAEALGRLYTYEKVADELGIEASTVRVHCNAISQKLPNPDALEPQLHVLLWAVHRRWLEQVAR